MLINRKKLVLGTNSSIKGETIFKRIQDFQKIHHDYKSAMTTINEIQRLEKSIIKKRRVFEIFQFDDFSFWWFFYDTLFMKLIQIISFVNNFTILIEKNQFDTIEVKNDFVMLPIIKQICDKNGISLKYSKLQYNKFLLKKKFLQNARKKRKITKLKNKIKLRKEIYFDKSKSLPKIKDAVLFIAPPSLRRDIFNHKKGISERGDYIMDDIKYLFDSKVAIISIDVFRNVSSNEKILKERLKSKNYFPLDLFLEEELLYDLKTKKYLNEFDNISNSNDFQKLFTYNGYSIWNELEELFFELTTAYYVLFWILIIKNLSKHLSQNKPKAIFLTSVTNPIELAFLVVAKNLGIKTISYQHGLVSKSHPAYSHTIFRSKEEPLGFPLPDLMLMFGEISKKELIDNKYPKEKLVEFGNPAFFGLEKLKKIMSKKKLLKKFGILENKKIILFTPSGIPKYIKKFDTDNFNLIIWQRLLNDFQKQDDYVLIIKPKAGDDIEQYKRILDDSKNINAKILQGDIFEIIFISSIIVATNSSAIIDSLCFDKPVVQVRFESIDYHMPFDKYDVVFPTLLDKMSEDLIKIMNDEQEQKKLKQNSSDFIKKYYNIPETDPEKVLQEFHN